MKRKIEAQILVSQSLDSDGVLSSERVAAVCAYISGLNISDENKIALLRAYKKMVASKIETQKTLAEFSGAVCEAVIADVEKLAERIRGGKGAKLEAKVEPSLLGGVRLTVGDTIIEKSSRQDLSSIIGAH